MQGAQRLPLPAGSVLGQCQHPPPPFPQRRLGDGGLGACQHLGVPAGAQCGIQLTLLGREPQFRQPGGLDPGGFPAVQIDQRQAAPQIERFVQSVLGTLRLAQREQLATTFQQPLEPLDIDLVGSQRKSVAERCGLDRVDAQGST